MFLSVELLGHRLITITTTPPQPDQAEPYPIDHPTPATVYSEPVGFRRITDPIIGHDDD